MPDYKWGSGDRPSLGSMATTTRFSDGSPGDTTTFESGVGTLTFSGACAVRDVTGAVTGLVDFVCPHVLTGFQFTVPSRSVSFTATTCIPGVGQPTEEVTYSEEAEWSLDGVTWTPITISSIGSSGGTTTKTGISITARYLRIITKIRFRNVQDSGTITCTSRISDIRVTATLAAPSSAPVVTGPTVCAGAENIITWSAVPCASGYDVEIDGDSPIKLGDVLTYTHAPATIGTPYTYRVRGYNSGGDGPWSSPIIATPCEVPMAPTDTTFAETSAVCEGRQISVWANAPVSGATAYRVYLYGPGIPSAGQIVYDGVLPTSSSPAVIKPVAYTTYSVRFQAYNNSGDGPLGNTIEITPCELGCGCPTWTRTECD